MTRIDVFPQQFAVVKEFEDDGPKFQFLDSRLLRVEDGECIYEISKAEWGRNMVDRNWVERDIENFEPEIQVLNCVYEDRVNPQRYRYWPLSGVYIPGLNGNNIPILEFQYKSWIPISRHLIPIQNKELFMRFFHRVNREHIDILRQNPNYLTPPPAPTQIVTPLAPNHPRFLSYRTSPPPPINISTQALDELLESFHDLPIPRNLTELLEQEGDLPRAFQVHDEASPRAVSMPLPIPQRVGELLIHDARAGTECCPITASPYSTATRLSVTSCFHVFDAESLETWRREGSNTCPTCRATIVNIVTQ